MSYPDWMDHGRCVGVDPELWFPAKGEHSRAAQQICAQCGVAAECLNYALTHGREDGIWGGLTERERRPLRRAGGAA